MTVSRSPVLLFKTPIQPFTSDSYRILLAKDGYEPIFVPVLAETFRTEELGGIIESGGKGYEGLVIMSRRAAEAWVKAAKAIDSHEQAKFQAEVREANGIRDELRREENDQSLDWSTIPLFTVGTSAVDVIEFAILPPRLRPNTSNPSLAAKSASALVPILLETPPHKGSYKPYLIARGDKSLDEIPFALIGAGREVQEVTVYETVEHPELEHRFEAIIADLGNLEEAWMAFFSPSSAGMVLPYLRRLGVFSRSKEAVGPKVAAIGGTTRKYLEGEGVKVDAVADEPKAEGLVAAIRRTGRDGPDLVGSLE